jgi:hypothetical protein
MGLPELEENWLGALRANGKTRKQDVPMVLKLFEANPGTACSEAQSLVRANGKER